MISATDIGLAAPADAPAIAMMSRDQVEHGLRWSWTAARVRNAITSRDTNVIVARQAGAIVGFALMKYGDELAHLMLLGVAPTLRRRGIASALLEWLEATLRIAGVAVVQVEVRESNAVARAFYAARGYEQVGATRGYYQGLETALRLVKELAPPGTGPAGPIDFR